MDKGHISLAEEYCILYHEGQVRKSENQEPFATHPFAVRDILVRYGYDDVETQVICLLHDVIEDTGLEEQKEQIEKRFGTVVYEGVYILSRNTVGKHSKELSPLFQSLGVNYLDNHTLLPHFLTEEAYKLRILFSRDTIKRIKIGDTIHNTENLPDLSKRGIERKLVDAENFYIPLGKLVAPIMVNELITNVENYKASGPYKELFGASV